MLISNCWQSKTALIMALGMTPVTALPVLISAPAIAGSEPYVVGQRFPRSSRVIAPAGTIIPVQYDKAERIIVRPNETLSLTLTVAQDIRSSSRVILIPEGSQVKGRLRPVKGGTQFFAQELILRNRTQRLPINATSQVITETETINEKTDPDILRGAAIGAAAAALLSEIFGDIDLGEVLIGAGIGVGAEVLLRGRKEVEVVIIDSKTDLDLTLQDDLVPRRARS
jgi:hypothetical protein